MREMMMIKRQNNEGQRLLLISRSST